MNHRPPTTISSKTEWLWMAQRKDNRKLRARELNIGLY